MFSIMAAESHLLCRVMERYPNNGRLLKIYGRFVEYVRNGEAGRSVKGPPRVLADAVLCCALWGVRLGLATLHTQQCQL